MPVDGATKGGTLRPSGSPALLFIQVEDPEGQLGDEPIYRVLRGDEHGRVMNYDHPDPVNLQLFVRFEYAMPTGSHHWALLKGNTVIIDILGLCGNALALAPALRQFPSATDSNAAGALALILNVRVEPHPDLLATPVVGLFAVLILDGVPVDVVKYHRLTVLERYNRFRRFVLRVELNHLDVLDA